MPIPKGWRSHSTAIGWATFIILSLPLLFFAVRIGFAEGFTFGKAIAAAIGITVVGLISWLLDRGLSRRSTILLTVASLLILIILAAYAAAISLLVGGLRIRIF